MQSTWQRFAPSPWACHAPGRAGTQFASTEDFASVPTLDILVHFIFTMLCINCQK